jgi:hypothetical protein
LKPIFPISKTPPPALGIGGWPFRARSARKVCACWRTIARIAHGKNSLASGIDVDSARRRLCLGSPRWIGIPRTPRHRGLPRKAASHLTDVRVAHKLDRMVAGPKPSRSSAVFNDMRTGAPISDAMTSSTVDLRSVGFATDLRRIASGSDIRLRPLGGAGRFVDSAAPFLYSPEYVEQEFSEVRLQDPA